VALEVLLTVDNGSSAVREVAHARERGVDVIVIDHHQVSEPEPEAFAHLNPHRRGALSVQGLAAVGVAFYLLVEVRRVCARRGSSPVGPSRGRTATSTSSRSAPWPTSPR
jgi:single-stranded-DNA-specific exonuclease